MIPDIITSILDEAPEAVAPNDLFDLDGETFLRIRNGCVETGPEDLLFDGGA